MGGSERKKLLDMPLTTLSSPIADSRAGSTVLRCKLRPAPATSAKAPRACALSSLKTLVRISIYVEKKYLENMYIRQESCTHLRGS